MLNCFNTVSIPISINQSVVNAKLAQAIREHTNVETIVQLIQEEGADPDAIIIPSSISYLRTQLYTPLQLAILYDNLFHMPVLLDYGADVDKTSKPQPHLPKGLVSFSKHLSYITFSIVKRLPNICLDKAVTPLELVIQLPDLQQWEEMFKLLLERGANPECIKDPHPFCPTHRSTSIKQLKIAKAIKCINDLPDNHKPHAIAEFKECYTLWKDPEKEFSAKVLCNYPKLLTEYYDHFIAGDISEGINELNYMN